MCIYNDKSISKSYNTRLTISSLLVVSVRYIEQVEGRGQVDQEEGQAEGEGGRKVGEEEAEGGETQEARGEGEGKREEETGENQADQRPGRHSDFESIAAFNRGFCAERNQPDTLVPREMRAIHRGRGTGLGRDIQGAG